ncbi:MAG: NADH-quinone oxidoreductase subunit N [Anaerolineae bacterium]|nr:NADH-quinone oxidoreductase subunit N [Anaerolineae bacterium]
MGTFDTSQLLAILPQILLVVLALIVLAADLGTPRGKKRSLGIVTAVGLLIVLIVTLAWPETTEPVFGGALRVDGVGKAFQAIFLLSGLLVALISMDFRPLRQDGAYYAMLLFSVLGMSLMAAAEDLVMLYVAIEIAGISAYVLVGYMREDALSAEAGVKYLLFGAFSSTVMVYGLSLLYGIAGGTGYGRVAAVLLQTPFQLAMVAFLLVLVGFGFKVAMVPMHFWGPDTYQGAPTPITAFISVASKAAGFAVLARALHFLFPALNNDWPALLVAISMVTITLGNLLAVPQRNIKRMLAYSSIAQAGYVLIGITAGGVAGITAVIFYLLVYAVTNIGAFSIVSMVASHIDSDDIQDYAALSRRSPALALAMMVALLSLAGVPPSGGFVGKLFLFAAGIKAGLVPLVVVAVLNVIVALYYYLNVVKVMYTVRSEHEEDAIAVPAPSRLVLVLSVTGVLLLGILAAPCYNVMSNWVTGWFS